MCHQREHLFGEIVEGEMRLNEYGRIAREEWLKTQKIRPNVEVLEDEFVVMPNHFHGIVHIINSDKQNGSYSSGDELVDDCVGKGSNSGAELVDDCAGKDFNSGDELVRAYRVRAYGQRNHNSRTSEMNLGAGKGLARQALTTGRYGHPIAGSLGTIIGAYKSAVTKKINLMRNTPGEKVWLRNYYEHIISTEKDYENIVNYIYLNPLNWELNDEYSDRKGV